MLKVQKYLCQISKHKPQEITLPFKKHQYMTKIFAGVSEKEITRTIAMMFNGTIDEYANCDVIIIGAGPAGLMASRDLARMGTRTLVVEQITTWAAILILQVNQYYESLGDYSTKYFKKNIGVF